MQTVSVHYCRHYNGLWTSFVLLLSIICICGTEYECVNNLTNQIMSAVFILGLFTHSANQQKWAIENTSVYFGLNGSLCVHIRAEFWLDGHFTDQLVLLKEFVFQSWKLGTWETRDQEATGCLSNRANNNLTSELTFEAILSVQKLFFVWSFKSNARSICSSVFSSLNFTLLMSWNRKALISL